MYARPKRQKQADIDRHITQIHAAMADKLIAQPTLVEQAYDVLEQRYSGGMMRYGSYLLWHGILESIDDPQLFRSLLLADDMRTASLRRQTILVGILTEEERQAAIAH